MHNVMNTKDDLTEGVGGVVGQAAPKVLEFGGQSIVLRFGRDQELEADALGMRYMSNVKYNPVGQRQVMGILELSMGTAEGSEWFSTHPYPKTRIEQIDKLLATKYAYVMGDTSFVYNKEQYQARALKFLAQSHPAPFLEGYRPLAAANYGPRWCAHCSNAGR